MSRPTRRTRQAVAAPRPPHQVNRSAGPPKLSRLNAQFDALAKTISDPHCIVFDRYAIWFYAISIVVFLVMCGAALQGSSIGIFSSLYHYGAPEAKPLLGTPRSVRVDEWNFHTPAILNQYLRPDRFSPRDTAVGPGNAGLIANLPVWHFTTLFRPEFWGFFILPFNYAYSVYWEAKWFILLTGLFSFLLLLTHSTPASITGALWFLFSGSTQWQLSWPSLLPDMVGLCCWIICLVCYLLVTTHLKRSVVAALCLVACAMDFAMCAYIPHQIPLVWFAVFVVAFWASSRLPVILEPGFRRKRAAVLLLACCSIAAVMAFLYRDIADTVTALANTSYPGRRFMGGGGYNLIVLGSHFLDLWKTQAHFPPSLGNICEGAGFLWLAPAVLFCLPRVRPLHRGQTLTLVSLGLLFVSIWSWEVLPVPASIARLTLFARVGAGRALPGLGLVNVVIVTLVLSWPRLPVTRRLLNHLIESAGIFSLVLAFLGLVNLGLGSFFSLITILAAAALATAAAKCLLEGWVLGFGLVVVLPGVLVYSLVNPLQRGFKTIFDSEVFQVIQSHPGLRQGKWLVFSPDPTAAGFFSSLGCSVYNGMKYVPDLKGLDLFDPTGNNHARFNQAGYLLADLPTNGSDEFEPRGVGMVLWRVNPLDRRLRKISIRYVAFLSQPPPEFLYHLRPVAPNPVGRFWLYELP